MSGLSHAELERLEGFRILPSPPDVDATTLILRTKSGEWGCVAHRETFLRLSAAIRRHFGEAEHSGAQS